MADHYFYYLVFLLCTIGGYYSCPVGDTYGTRFFSQGFYQNSGSSNREKWFLNINVSATCSGSINNYTVQYFGNLNSGTYGLTIAIWKPIISVSDSTTYEKDTNTVQYYTYPTNNKRRKRDLVQLPSFNSIGIRKGSVIGVYLDSSNPLRIIGGRVPAWGTTYNGVPIGACVGNSTILTCNASNFQRYTSINAEFQINTIDCNTPPTSNNSMTSLLDGDTEYGARVKYTCNAGYNNTDGVDTISCQLNGTWSSPIPYCSIVSCDDPGIPVNGQRNGGSFTYNSALNFTCNVGYTLLGVGSLTCLANGSWNNVLPSCPPINCGNPGIPANGQKISQNFTFNSTVSYRCDPGYTLTGSATITCLSTGFWDNIAPSCPPIDCGNPGVPINGQIITENSFFYNSTVMYECDFGYSISGHSSITCLSNGTWDNSIPMCLIVNCSDPGNPINSIQINGGNFSYNSTVSYSCELGYNLTGADTLTCLATGSWDAPVPLCHPVNCSNPGTPINGARNGNLYTYNSNITYQCDSGYSLFGSVILTCLSNGSWNASVPLCYPNCNDPGTPDNGQRVGNSFIYNAVILYSCNNGYNLTGESTLTCLSDGSWSNTIPSCNPVNCGDPGTITNGDRAGDVFTYQAYIIYSCHDDFSLVGSPIITCQSNGLWSDTVPVCSTHSDCTDPGIPANGVRIGNNFSYNSSVSFSCYPGYQLNGSGVITCDTEGKWNSTNLPSCDIIYCSAPAIPDNGNVSYTSLSVNSSVYFTCNTGYKLIGNTNITCLPNGQWSNASVPSCNITVCPPLTPPSHGYLTPLNQYTYGTVVTFSCDPGYDLVGMSTTTCIDDGQWSADTPQCKAPASSSTSTTSSDLHVTTSSESTSTTSVQLSATSQTLTSSIKKTSSVVTLSTSQSTTSTTSVMPTSSAENDGDSTVIIGAAVGAVLFVILLLIVAILLIVLFVTRSKRKSGNLDITPGDTSITNPILFSTMYDSVPIRSKQAATTTCKDSQLSDYDNTLDPKHQMRSQSASLPYEADADALYTQLDDIETEGENRYPIEEIYDTGDVANMVLPPPLYLDDEAKGVPNSLYFIQEEDFELEKEAPPQGAEAMYFTLDEDAVKGSEAVESTDGGGNQAPVYFTLENERKTVPKFSSKKLAKRYTVAFLQPGDNEDDIYGQIQQSSSPMITKESLILSKTIGSGQFGNVCKGQWKKPNGDTINVAVKMLQDGASEQEKIKFLQEAAIMSQFNNSNVIKLHGVVHDETSPMIVIEYMPKGDLFGVLQKMRPDPGELVHQNTPQLLLSFCQQVCLGMTYLSSKGFIHRDLAARNILVSADNVCKIIDFGLSRDLEDENYYVSRKGAMIPVKWTAPEALNYRKYSTASDVWSYGCLMYEIWSIGHKPYENDSNMTALRKITGSERLPPPPGCPEAIYSLMISCWHPVADERPSFHDIMVSLLQPNKIIMKIPESALSSHPQAGSLGGTLKAGENMYPEMQCTYADTMDTAL